MWKFLTKDGALKKSTVDATIPRVVAGKVNADGSKASGSGFTSVKNSTGRYTLTFSTAFKNVPAFVGSPNNAGGYIISIESSLGLTTTVLKVCVINPGVGAADSPFDFIASDVL